MRSACLEIVGPMSSEYLCNNAAQTRTLICSPASNVNMHVITACLSRVISLYFKCVGTIELHSDQFSASSGFSYSVVRILAG